MRAPRWIAVATIAVSTMAQADDVKVYAAGSLRAALTDVARAFTTEHQAPVVFEFGPSGLLRDRLMKGEGADVFASANMEHPKALSDAGKSGPPLLFARNKLCVLAAPRAEVSANHVLDRMLDPKVKLGTSTPKADPSGDYAWQVFERAEKVKPGAYETLSKKALQLVGGPASPPAPANRSAYGALLADGSADMFLTYCTNAALASKEEAGLTVFALPAELEVGAEYGLVVMANASAAGRAFAEFLLSPAGKALLAAHGFSAS
jgi:molybdenum ABC transporter molybdate-binding protein